MDSYPLLIEIDSSLFSTGVSFSGGHSVFSGVTTFFRFRFFGDKINPIDASENGSGGA